MRRTIPLIPRVFLVAGFFTGAILGAARATHPKRAHDQAYRYHSLMPQYWEFIKGNVNSDDASTLTRFRAEVVNPHREVFDAVAAGWIDDASLPRFIHALDGKFGQLHRVDRQFPLRLAVAWQRFAQQVPDLKPGADVFLIPAPRIAVGGGVRPLGERNASHLWE